MGGTSQSTSQTQQQSTTAPWLATQPALNDVIGKLGGLVDTNTALTPDQSAAFNQIQANASTPSPYTDAVNSATTALLGGGADYSPFATNAYGAYQTALSPVLASINDPMQNPAVQAQLSGLTTDVTNQVNQAAAAAGRDLSPDAAMAVARGVTQGAAPILANAQQLGVNAAGSLYGAGSGMAQLLSGLQQTQFGNMQAGANMVPFALGAANLQPQSLIAAQQAEQQMPFSNLAGPAGILAQYAGLGSQSSGTGSTTGTQTMSPAQQAWGWLNSFANLNKSFAGGSSGG